MASNTSHHILHRMVPLICQSLLAAPQDEAVWLEGLGMLCNPKLHNAMSATSSIWLPLLLKGLETVRPRPVIIAALSLLGEMAATLEPMKSCLLKPLRALAKDTELGLAASDEMSYTVGKLGLLVYDSHNKPIGGSVSVSRVVSRSDDSTPGLSRTHRYLPSPRRLLQLQTLATSRSWPRFSLATCRRSSER